MSGLRRAPINQGSAILGIVAGIPRLSAQDGKTVSLCSAPRPVGERHFDQARVKAGLQVSPVKVGPVAQAQRAHEFRAAHLPMQTRDEPDDMWGNMMGDMWGNMMGGGRCLARKRHR